MLSKTDTNTSSGNLLCILIDFDGKSVPQAFFFFKIF